MVSCARMKQKKNLIGTCHSLCAPSNFLFPSPFPPALTTPWHNAQMCCRSALSAFMETEMTRQRAIMGEVGENSTRDKNKKQTIKEVAAELAMQNPVDPNLCDSHTCRLYDASKKPTRRIAEGLLKICS
ncbi:hypothetical protein, unlikely [Trypanosoma brucei gambiense DAL972]|uniref:Uncharacterized protein n=1 Tax=Trypanosoma brucei gambiense (strain MHOM/CI/86/DAL972) TaxID=679716 RepID=C9ZTA9_TRYB9|nr:hypothetical protein, unlikely [Trypanosoma brucei gambiense DAL972]CBH12644.1 hypothetical protein, unlikely [Trypanosoma brucei gambiense DAL972]|eukprot:XP_011774924.1 hypothetical protein, unlikely [Trypanosoma brucei gambiense DAL972]